MIKSNQLIWANDRWDFIDEKIKSSQLCVIYGSRPVIDDCGLKAVELLKNKYPNAKIVTVSTAGNVVDSNVEYNTLVATCINFEKTNVAVKSFKFDNKNDFDLGKKIANSFDTENLQLVMLFSTANINAGSLIDGINEGFENKILVSGGVAGDGLRFEKTVVGVDSDIQEDNIVAVGYYSSNLEISHGSKGGWNTFGPPRLVTKASDNVLYEIDNLPVLDVYKEYLGQKAKELPSSGLLFPFAIIDENTNEFIVRGIQNIDEETKSIILFGNVEVGQYLRLMKANRSILIDGAGESANDAMKCLVQKPQLVMLVSCVARRMALDQLIDDEIDEVRESVGDLATIFGFYSYSEFSPVDGAIKCSLHNQTMTTTIMSEN